MPDEPEGSPPRKIRDELWSACAGPFVYVPKVGDKVFYFPQGHIEQVEAYTEKKGKRDIPVYNLPPKILCEVVFAGLKAEIASDEVYAQITLLPEGEQEGVNLDEEVFRRRPENSFSRFFCKKLTPSDTSTHGGFSVPKRQADEILPPLDMLMQPPVQELVAEDLHGFKWRFRHIYRGQPKRHLLTSGWSSFVSTKKLVIGDACVLLRGEDGDLRIGIRRAKKPDKNRSASVISAESLHHGVLAGAYHAFSTGTMFTVYYRPWISPAEFVIPVDRYVEASRMAYTIGTRFRMRFEGDDLVEHRVSGTIVGVSDADPIKWPISEWRCLEVMWDVTSNALAKQERLSPWNIDLIEHTDANIINCAGSRPKRICSDDGSIGGNRWLNPRGLISMTGKNEASSSSSSPTRNSSRTGRFKLFGVNLVDDNPIELPSNQIETSLDPSGSRFCETKRLPDPSKGLSLVNRSRIKVLKHGTALGRSVDIGRFSGYEELISELDYMFEFNGRLADGTSGWRVAFTDNEGDTMMIGHQPWKEFVRMVRRMLICPKEVV